MEADKNHLLSPGQLRRIKVFADLTDEQLAIFVGLVEVVQAKPNRVIVKMHEIGDCMYLILGGEVGVSQTVEGRETFLAKLETGDFFGELSLFDHAPRSADVIATGDCTLLKISKSALDGILKSHPDVAALFLLALMRTIATRLRRVDRKYTDSMLLSRFWDRGGPSATTNAAQAKSLRPLPKRPA